MAYAVELHRDVRRFLRRLSRASEHDYFRLEAAIDDLASNPRPRSAVKVRGRGPMLRVRVGEYRIVYAVFDADRLVAVEEIARRTTTTYKER